MCIKTNIARFVNVILFECLLVSRLTYRAIELKKLQTLWESNLSEDLFSSFGEFLYLWWVGGDVVENIDENKEESYKQGHPTCNHFGKLNHGADANNHWIGNDDDDSDCDDHLVQYQGVWGRRSMRRQQKGRKADSRWWCTTSRAAPVSAMWRPSYHLMIIIVSSDDNHHVIWW